MVGASCRGSAGQDVTAARGRRNRTLPGKPPDWSSSQTPGAFVCAASAGCRHGGTRAGRHSRRRQTRRVDGTPRPIQLPREPNPSSDRPSLSDQEAGEAELGYMFLPEAWGCGYAAEACAAALDWFADALPGEPVVLCTQTASHRSMRLAAKLAFTEVERFEEFGAEQWFGVWSSVTPSG
ncbi:GNAT family N-acetyltransferase [Streptomyces sp. NPDC096152]|uniref:GNAT family N-acetyltransferase n=1 Tax=Streptomyces sp. NPDC096152 TaxID=3366078 RepID=UPI0037FE9F01